MTLAQRAEKIKDTRTNCNHLISYIKDGQVVSYQAGSALDCPHCLSVQIDSLKQELKELQDRYVSKRKPVSPCDCTHAFRFVESNSKSGIGVKTVDYSVHVCVRCGTILVAGRFGSEYVRVSFDLPTWPLVRAASQWARLIEASDKAEAEKPSKAP